MPRLRRLFHSRADEEGDAATGHLPREHRVRQRHRLLQPVSVLHEHLRHAQHPRPGPGDCHGPQERAARPASLGDHRRRRRPVDRRQSLHPLHSPQRRSEGHHVQQPHLRPDQGAIFAHLAAGQSHQEHALRRDRQPAQSAVGRHRLRGDVRRPLDRRQHQAPGRSPQAGRRAQGHGLRRDLPELQHLQRRRLGLRHRQGDQGRHRRSSWSTASR